MQWFVSSYKACLVKINSVDLRLINSEEIKLLQIYFKSRKIEINNSILKKRHSDLIV